MTNNEFGILINDQTIEFAPTIFKEDGAVIINPTEKTYYKHGYSKIIEQTLPEQEGFSIVPNNYTQHDEITIYHNYKYQEIEKTPRVFSVLKIYVNLTEAGKWQEFKTLIDNTTLESGVNLGIAFDKANNLKEDNPYFEEGLAYVKTEMKLSDEFVEEILSNSIYEP